MTIEQMPLLIIQCVCKMPCLTFAGKCW